MNKITRNICLIYFYVNDKQFNGTVISQELVDFLLPRFPEIEKDITKYVSGTEIL